MLFPGLVDVQDLTEAGGGGGELGATPAFDSVGTTATSSTLAATHTIAHPATVAEGDLLLCVAVGRNTNGDASLAMHASMTSAGWQHLTGSPYEAATVRCMLVAWKIAVGDEGGTNIPGGIVGSGSTTNDSFLGYCQRWTAADGWAAAGPFESITSTTESNNTTTAAPSVTPTDENRIAVSIFGGNSAPSSFSFTGETGGDWGVVSHVTNSTLVVINTQTADLSAGNPISGGSATMSGASGGPLVGFALAPSGEGGGGGPEPGEGLFVTWYPGYDANNMPASEIPWSLGITHLGHFAAAPVSDSTVDMDQFSPELDPAAVMSSRTAASSTAKVLLVMGGAASHEDFDAAITNNQALFVDNIVAEVVEHGYDGVDIDWEGHGFAEADADQFDGFMRALKADLVTADPSYILTTSSNGRPVSLHTTFWMPMMKALYDEGIIEYAYIQLIQMAQPSFSSGNVWHHEAIFSGTSDFGTPGFQTGVDEAIDSYIEEGFDPAALIIGSTLSGRPWTGGIMDIDPGSGPCFEPGQQWDTGGDPLGRPDLGGEVLYRDIIRLVPEPLSVDLSASRRGCGGVITWANAAANASQPHVIGSAGTGTSTAPNSPSITTTVDNCTAISAIAIVGAQDLDSLTPPGGWTLIGKFRSHTDAADNNGSYVTLGLAYKTMPTAGATGAATWTNAASREWTGIQIALTPAASTPPSIRGSESLSEQVGPADPQTVYLYEQSYTSGDYVLGVYAVSGAGNTVDGMSAGDDTYAELVEATNTNLGLAFYEGTVVGDFGGPTTYRRDVLSGNTPFLSNPDSGLFLSFDDEVSLADKTEYVVQTRSCRGVGIWAVNWDYDATGANDAEKHPLVAAINAVLNP